MNYFLSIWSAPFVRYCSNGLGQVTLGVHDGNDLFGWLSLLERNQVNLLMQYRGLRAVIEASCFMSHYFSNDHFLITSIVSLLCSSLMVLYARKYLIAPIQIKVGKTIC